MPGMAAAPSIFQNIDLSPDLFDVHFLEWHVPTKGISVSDYAKEMCENIKEENPVLIGVSFGGSAGNGATYNYSPSNYYF